MPIERKTGIFGGLQILAVLNDPAHLGEISGVILQSAEVVVDTDRNEIVGAKNEHLTPVAAGDLAKLLSAHGLDFAAKLHDAVNSRQAAERERDDLKERVDNATSAAADAAARATAAEKRADAAEAALALAKMQAHAA